MVERLKEMWQDARQMRDERGLTLVELLVVVVILGIIAAISVIAIGGLIENSRKDAQVANAKQLVNAAKLYVSGQPLTSASETLYFVGGVTGEGDTKTGENKLESYIDDLKDPMNEDTVYKNASVLVSKTGDKYTYKVSLKGTQSTKSDYFVLTPNTEIKRANIGKDFTPAP